MNSPNVSAPDLTDIVVCGHRGAPVFVAENTIATFARAEADGATWIEFDVRPAGDDTFIVHHDPETTTGVHVRSTNPVDLSSDIPSLAEVAERFGHLGLNIELKTSGTELNAANYVRLALAEVDRCLELGAERLLVTSFSAKVMRLVKEQRGDLMTGLLFHKRGVSWAIKTAVTDGHEWIVPWHRLVSRTGVGAAHDAGLRVSTWTVNAPAHVARVARAGVDMIIGDDPGLIIDSLAQAGDSSD